MKRNEYIFMLPAVISIILVILIYIFDLDSKHIESSYIVGKTDTTKVTKIIKAEDKKYKINFVKNKKIVDSNNVVILDSIETDWTEFELGDTVNKVIGKVKIKDKKFEFSDVRLALQNMILSRVDTVLTKEIQPFYKSELFYISIIAVLLILILL